MLLSLRGEEKFFKASQINPFTQVKNFEFEPEVSFLGVKNYLKKKEVRIFNTKF